jgi:hypothetical protein
MTLKKLSRFAFSTALALAATAGCAADTESSGDHTAATGDDLTSWGHIGARILYCSPPIVSAMAACDGLRGCVNAAFTDGLYSAEVLKCLAQETASGGTAGCMQAAREAASCLRAAGGGRIDK